LTIWEVVDAVEPIKRIRECPLAISSHDGELCPLHRRLDNAMAMVEESFRGTTVAEVLAQPGSTTPLCEAKRVMMIELADVKKSRAKSTSTKRKKKH
jgi:DNA-binding IscR family transcriptional regulator